MARYYVNKNSQSTGEHEVHKEGCYRMPLTQNQIFLGYFPNANYAVREAKRYFDNVDGCYYCCSEAHRK
ncbi:MAG: hypothetical protein IJ220_01555 [Clostridia bacterium]|nr:hypothetical protein [Clostridia bacterium]